MCSEMFFDESVTMFFTLFLALKCFPIQHLSYLNILDMLFSNINCSKELPDVEIGNYSKPRIKFFDHEKIGKSVCFGACGLSFQRSMEK